MLRPTVPCTLPVLVMLLVSVWSRQVHADLQLNMTLPTIEVEHRTCPMPPSPSVVSHLDDFLDSVRTVLDQSQFLGEPGLRNSFPPEVRKLAGIGGDELAQMFRITATCLLNSEPAVRGLSPRQVVDITGTDGSGPAGEEGWVLPVYRAAVEERLREEDRERVIRTMKRMIDLVAERLKVERGKLFANVYLMDYDTRLHLIGKLAWNLGPIPDTLQIPLGYGSTGVAFQTRQPKVTIRKGKEVKAERAVILEPDQAKKVPASVTWAISLPLFESAQNPRTILGIVNIGCFDVVHTRADLDKLVGPLSERFPAEIAGIIAPLTRIPR
ncbi:MAG: hypothetical protein AB1411_01900 [Nitrospirota bacterium]